MIMTEHVNKISKIMDYKDVGLLCAVYHREKLLEQAYNNNYELISVQPNEPGFIL